METPGSPARCVAVAAAAAAAQCPALGTPRLGEAVARGDPGPRGASGRRPQPARLEAGLATLLRCGVRLLPLPDQEGLLGSSGRRTD